jgi:hypothetical protein
MYKWDLPVSPSIMCNEAEFRHRRLMTLTCIVYSPQKTGNGRLTILTFLCYGMTEMDLLAGYKAQYPIPICPG